MSNINEIKNEKLENEIEKLKNKNRILSKKLDVLYNVVEVSNYINSFIVQENLVQVINDMIIGILGVKYSTIYLIENDNLIIKATNHTFQKNNIYEKYYKYMNNGQAYIINTEKSFDKKEEINSVMGIPIKLGDNLIGYIIGEHSHYGFFNEEHKIFMNTVANQVAIAIENSYLYRELDFVAKTDPLMKIYNRRNFFNIVEERISSGNIKKYSIVMIDLDNFKKVNDTLGHQFGDKVLVETIDIVKKYLKQTDVIARYGGEEIILYIEDFKDEKSAFDRIDEIRVAIQGNCISDEENSIYITASLGMSFSTETFKALSDVIKIADTMLYKAKYSGKNRVVSSYIE